MHHTQTLFLNSCPVSSRPFRGIGVQADAYIFDEHNRQAGVTDHDLEMISTRLQSLKPALSRLFVEVPWFNPSLDGLTFTWDSPDYINLVRQLRILQEAGALINLVLFKPLPTQTTNMDPVVGAMLILLERLTTRESFKHIRWLTLWNEPDSLFQHDSDLHRRLFKNFNRETRPDWTEYVRLNQMAYQDLITRKLYPHIRLLVADTVWGAPMRQERLRMSLEAFGSLDVDYSYHNYSTEIVSEYKENHDFAYNGMAAEATSLRSLLGPNRELVLWEFNTVGIKGFGSYYPGVGPAGIDLISSIEGAVDATAKVLLAAANGIDGFCLWCLHDMIYCANPKAGSMRFGLWRFCWEGWFPRPIYHYYAALAAAFRPGTLLYGVNGTQNGVIALAGQREGQTIIALLNSGPHPQQVTLPWHGHTAQRTTISPTHLPPDAERPAAIEDTLLPENSCLTLELTPSSLTLIRGPC